MEAKEKVGNVLPIKYFGFRSGESNKILSTYFYDCEGTHADGYKDIRNECRYAEATEHYYKEFYKITDIPGARTDGYLVNLPFYLQALREAHILFTKGPTSNPADYENEIGIYLL